MPYTTHVFQSCAKVTVPRSGLDQLPGKGDAEKPGRACLRVLKPEIPGGRAEGLLDGAPSGAGEMQPREERDVAAERPKQVFGKRVLHGRSRVMASSSAPFFVEGEELVQDDQENHAVGEFCHACEEPEAGKDVARFGKGAIRTAAPAEAG